MSMQPPPGALAAAQALLPHGRAHYCYATLEENASALLADQTSAAQVIAACVRVDLLDLIRKVEADMFRTVTDTGANLNALCVWNTLRRHAGLPRLTKDDLPAYDAERKGYVMPPDSKLLTNTKGGGIV